MPSEVVASSGWRDGVPSPAMCGASAASPSHNLLALRVAGAPFQPPSPLLGWRVPPPLRPAQFALTITMIRSPIRSTARLLLASVGRVRWPCVPTGSAAPVTRSLRPQLTLPAPSAARPVALTLTVTFSRHICRPRVAPAVRVPCGRDPLPGAACQTALGFLLCVVCVVLS